MIFFFEGWTTTTSAMAVDRFACKPGEFFKYNCSSCECSSDGKSARCSVLKCEPEGTTTSPKPDIPKNFLCRPKATFKQGCNYCFCNENGKGATCTAAPCPNPKEDESFRCDPGKLFRRDCHNCTCSRDGKSASCTLLPWCEPRPRDGPRKTTTESSPKEEEVVEGSEVEDLNSICEPGQVFKRDCNICICDRDGQSSVCTLSECPKVEQEFRCQPGEKFKQDCNSCVCSHNGKTASCTAGHCVRFDCAQ
ncbi:hypothetical protein QAD02_024238 [Eretmocerus hayati]|uniref:Uncharacterized protein n=1 Tax=Eretmocerus hayati TaxID=131215 RepID=A0ACC2PZ86_9HYME|nr:hypothetical protein QAD02_024238 [Eretmocerus hayati]